MVMRWFKYFPVLVMCILAYSGVASATVMVHVDRFHISEDETVNLTIEVTGTDSGDPQTAPLLKDFEIISNSHSSSYSLINGSSSSKSTYQLILKPRHAGALTIPSLKVGSASTNPIMIQVSKVQARTSPSGLPTGDIWISMEITPKQVRVQQQAIITIRVFQAVGLNQARLSEPEAEHAVIERLGKDSSYQKRENNRTWQVTERRYALFPQQSGRITIHPVQLDGSVLTGGTSFFQTARPVRVRSNSLSLDVAAIPDGWTGDHWLPAKKISIEESWPQSGTKFKVGEPITRTLTIRADGLSSSQLPEFAQDLPDHLKSYADKPVLMDNKSPDGVYGSRQEKIAIMPMHAGTYILPAIDLVWWNTRTEKAEHATLPVRTFTVMVASSPAVAPPPVASGTEPVKPPEQPVVASEVSSDGSVASWWQWLAVISTTGWLSTLVYGWTLRRRRRVEQVHSNVNRTPTDGSLEEAGKAIEKACRNHDAKACEQALLHIAALLWPDRSIHSLVTLAQYCDATLKQEIVKLESALYASDTSAWHGDSLLQAFREGGFQEQESVSDKTEALPGLYPD